MRGPIDYIIVKFEGNNFDGSILKALAESIDKGVIALVALAVVTKSKDGTITKADVASMGDDYIAEFSQKYPTDEDEINQDDIDEVADLLEADTSAGLLIVEQLWAKPLKEALLKAKGTLVAEGRIHPEAAAELESKGGK